MTGLFPRFRIRNRPGGSGLGSTDALKPRRYVYLNGTFEIGKGVAGSHVPHHHGSRGGSTYLQEED